MADQQVAIANQRQPALQQDDVARSSRIEAIHAQQVGVVRETSGLRATAQRGGTQRFDHPRLRQGACRGGPTRVAQPRSARRALQQRLDQHVAHLRQLMHVLMPVHVIGATAQSLFEGVELHVDLQTQRAAIEQPGDTAHGQRRQPARSRGERKRRQVQMQAEVDPIAVQRAQRGHAAAPRLAPDHATDGLYASQVGQVKTACVHAWVQSEVVGADGQPRRAHRNAPVRPC